MKALKFLTSLITVIALSACSTQNREAAPQVSEDELSATFDDMVAQQDAPGIQSMSLNDVLSGGGRIYHVRESSGRPAASVLSLTDMSVVDNVWPDYTPVYETDLSAVDVMFVDNINENGDRYFTLMISGTYSSDAQSDTSLLFVESSDANDYVFTKDGFETEINSAISGVRIIIRSDDLSDKYNDELADSVKLSLYVDNGDGALEYIGQVSTMAGFSK
jgi:hypothetical protein